jgi:hypothetical protein
VNDEAVPMGDLFAFANALAALVGGAVAVEDPSGNLLAYSNLDQPIDEARRQTILGRGNPASWSRLLESEGYAHQLATAEGPVRITDPEERASERVAVLVRAGTEVLGSIWVVAGDEPLGPEAERVVADATPLAAMQLLHHRTHQDSSRRERGQALRALLAGDASAVEGMGIDAGTTCQVVAFHLAAAEEDEVRLSVGRSRLLDAITMACEAFRRRVLCTWAGPTIYALFPEVTATGAERLAALADDICARTSTALGVEVLAGISEPHVGLASAPECRSEADRVLRVLRERGGRVARLEDVRIPSVLLALGDLVRSRPDLRVPGVQVLAKHDADSGKSYVASLRAYLRAGGSIPGGAALLGIHANTMRYRVTRIEEVSGLRLDDPDHRLVASLELLALS